MGHCRQGDRAKLLRTARVQVHTRVVPTNVAYPTDSGLLAKAASKPYVIINRQLVPSKLWLLAANTDLSGVS